MNCEATVKKSSCAIRVSAGKAGSICCNEGKSLSVSLDFDWALAWEELSCWCELSFLSNSLASSKESFHGAALLVSSSNKSFRKHEPTMSKLSPRVKPIVSKIGRSCCLRFNASSPLRVWSWALAAAMISKIPFKDASVTSLQKVSLAVTLVSFSLLFSSLFSFWGGRLFSMSKQMAITVNRGMSHITSIAA